MTQIKPPLTVRDNPKDEAVRKASNPAYAYDNPIPRRYSPPTAERDLTGSRVEPTIEPVVRVRRGKHSPMPNEGPHVKWPGIYPDRK